MKKLYIALMVLAFVLSSTLAGFSEAADAGREKTSLKLAASPGPYGDMFDEAIAPYLEKKYGYSVEVIEFSDGTAAHQALIAGEIDIAIIGHLFYENFLEKNLQEVFTPIYVVPTAGGGIYSHVYKSLDEVKDGDQFAIPSEASNQPRVLDVAERAKLIELDKNADPDLVTVADIAKNPHNLKFVEVDRYLTPKALDSVQLSFIYGNVAFASGVDLSTAIYAEQLKEEYKNCLVVYGPKAKEQYVKDIQEAALSDEFKAILGTPKYASFQWPLKSIPDKFYTDQGLEIPKP
jgi:D-methionine transport system substrate-binding protein